MARICLEKLTKNYGTVEVLSNIDLIIEEKGFCVLIGPSGCGKSTLLRIIAGLERATSGTIHIGDEDVTMQRPGARDLAMVFQSYALYPHKTVRDNLGFSLAMHKYKKSEIIERVEKVADLLGLASLLDRRPAQLSGGQRQRVAMGRAMVRDPSVFLFDEPLSNLDAKLRVQMRTEIRELHQRIGATTVYVTHDQIEAMTMADRIIILNEGKIEQSGPPLELFDNPKNVFVAGFLGSPSINLIDGIFTKATGKTAIEVPGCGAVEVSSNIKCEDGQKVTLGFRPHVAKLSGDGPLTGQIKVVEPTGVETLVFVDLGGVNISCQLSRQNVPKVGETVNFSVLPKDILVFDRQTGERI